MLLQCLHCLTECCCTVLQGGTYGGSIIGCAAANATIDAIEEDGMLDNARDRGVQLVQVSTIVHGKSKLP